MKTTNTRLLQWILCVAFIFVACKKENPETNLSTFSSVSVDATVVVIPSFIVDHTGRYLLVCIRDWNYSNSIIKKINLNTLKVEAEYRIPGTVPISVTNILLTDNNEMITTFFHFASRSMLIYKFDINLKVMKIDTAAVVYGGNFGRRRMVKSGPNRIVGVETNITNDDRFFLRYMTLDDNLNILSSVMDSSDVYGDVLLFPQQFIKTSDGGTLYAGEKLEAPLYTDDIFLEKRDANFNLQWRALYKTGTSNSPGCVQEVNGKYYVWCHGQSSDFNNKVFMLVYDHQGNLIENKPISGEAEITADAENMVVTDNGDFLMLALTKMNSSSELNKGLLLHSNASLSNITYKTFGGERDVQVSALMRMEPNKYLLMYIDRSFAPDGVKPRLVFQYVDAEGNFIE